MNLPLFSAPASAAVGKKGWAGSDGSLHRLFGVHWHYNWTARNDPSQAIEFVPMIKGAEGLKQSAAVKQLPRITHLLGFNEPERTSQGSVSVQQALDLWPQLEQLAQERNLRLGSPANSSDQDGMNWFHAFMDQAKRRKLRLDFIAVHWYRSRNASAFESFVTELSRQYRMPVWVTEFNGWSGPEDENCEFLKGALRFLERSRQVERYAYFNPPKGQPHSLLAEHGGLTRMGELYRDT